MSKAVGKIIVGVGLVVAAVAIPGVGGILAGAAYSASAAVGATLGAATLAAIQASATILLATTGLSIAAQGYQQSKANQVPASQITRLTVSLDPSTPRKIVFGNTAMATDLRASIPTGTDQEIHEYIFCVASHTVESIDEIWFEDRRAWTLAGGVDTFYSGYMSAVFVRNPGTNANGIAINSQWTANCTLTGCAYIYFHVKRTGNNKKAESPLPSGIPSRVTIIGKGMKVYDPRRDSTVTGGSGSHRAATQTTWEYSNGGTDLGNNPALQILTYLLGWQINSILAVGKGMPSARLDLPSFITAANVCDEAVTLAAGGTQRRYEAAGVFSEADPPNVVLNALLTACNGRLTDVDGRLGIVCSTNDLTGTLYAFTDDDVVGGFEWRPSPSIHETHNIVRGRFTDPSSNSLYQLVDYPIVSLTSPDGIDRVMTLDLPCVQEGRRAQRIAKQVLQREQYLGTLSATFGIRAWGVKVGTPVKVTLSALGFSEKLFRVVEQAIRSDGMVEMVLREEATALYAWSAEESAVVTAAPPTVYDQLNNPLAVIQGTDIGVENGADVTATAQIVVTVPSVVTYAADSNGTIVGTITSESIRVSKGGTSIKLDNGTSYAITPLGGITAATVDNTNGSGTKGDISGIAFTGNSGSIEVVVTVGGVAQPKQIIQFVKDIAPPPATGGSGYKMATDTSLAQCSATTDTVLSDTLTVTIASGESLYGTAPLDFEIDGGTFANRSASCKWQYFASGVWNDFVAGTYVNSTVSASSGRYSGDVWLDPTPGYISVAQTKSGLAAGDYPVRLIGKLNATGRTASFYGTARVDAKV